LIFGVGLYLTWILKGIQIRYLPYALRIAFLGDRHIKKNKEKGDISHFQSLMTSLAATIGISNIAGVATAVTVGGLGSLFWMWVTALLGMATKYAEALLAVRYREKDGNNEMCGGPMYFISKGMGWKPLAAAFALFGAISALGGGNMLQANSVADVMLSKFSINAWWTAAVLVVIVGATIVGGIKSIGKVAGVLVPAMAILYISGGIYILCVHYSKIPGVFSQIFSAAFTGEAACGGVLGAIQVGVIRGLMTSESGLGTASIAAAAAKTDSPGRQALVSMTGSFLATIVMCTVTGLVLTVTEVVGTTCNGQQLNGASMTVVAFNSVFSFGGYIVTAGVILFGLTTLIGWAYYGEKCVEYLFGVKALKPYRCLFICMIVPGAILDLEVVWTIADIANGLMAIPNLIGLCFLSKIILSETKEFLAQLKKEEQ
jgi:AGCS family alanine or glycine:cation symporter